MVRQQPFRTVQDLIRSQLGADNLDFGEGDATQVNVADSIILRPSPGRAAFLVVNLAANAIFLRPSQIATTTAGIRIGPTGGSLSVTWLDDFILSTLAWHAVSTVDAQAIYIIEVVLR